ncbi:cytochrome P450 6B2 [Manduca sexta]|uniref:cytochrome P450 6B2 n=1 Tax=Manduca sexta TaxID=7130 RepID=UPI00188E7C3A|nr:cytochrome P450 6B2 [Manduca sexta]
MFTTLLCTYVVFLLSCLVYYHYKKKLEYWKKKNVPHLKPMPLLGNYKDYLLLKEIPGVILQQICEKFPDEPFIGAYYGTDPALIIQDPELIKLVITKDFYYFNGREVTAYNGREPVTKNVFFSCCDEWKVLRQNLTPLFTTAKMKNMFYLIEKCTHVFEDVLEKKVSASQTVILNNLMASFTIDCIGSCTFGLETNVMRKPENNPFREIAFAIFEKSTYRGIKNVMRNVWPGLFYLLGLRFFPSHINEFFVRLLTEVFESRQYKPSPRNDFVDIVLSMTKTNRIIGEGVPNFKTGEVKKTSIEATNDLLAAQCVSFFGAGFETSATTSSFTLYELAKRPDIQEKVLEEVDTYIKKYNNKLNYNVVSELPYLDACIDEALRFYPVLSSLNREAMADYTFPTGLKVEKGMRIHIPVYHLQRDPKYFPEPEVFRPERFLGEEKLKINPHVYMPFGGGPRFCIGMRFAKMQMLAGLVTILKNYRVEMDSSTPQEVQFDPRILVTQPLDPIMVRFVPRKIK